MKKIKLAVMVSLSVLTVWFTAMISMDVRAAGEMEGRQGVDVIRVVGANVFNAEICNSSTYTQEQKEQAGCNETRTAGGVGIALINIVLGLVGIVAVVMIIVGGVSMSTSNGDAGKVKKAKDTIAYAVIGMLIALLAFAIVNFVLSGVS